MNWALKILLSVFLQYVEKSNTNLIKGDEINTSLIRINEILIDLVYKENIIGLCPHIDCFALLYFPCSREFIDCLYKFDSAGC